MTAQRTLRALAIGAHPDDVEIYCLGLLLRLRGLGWDIDWAIATDGHAYLPKGATPESRRAEAIAAGAKVGVQPIFMGWQDGEVTAGPREISQMRALLAHHQPDVVITHCPEDYHPDHRTVSSIVRATIGLRTSLVFADAMAGIGFLPEFHVGIDDVIDEKHASLREHHSQASDEGLESLKAWNRGRGLQTQDRAVKYAEAYCYADAYHRARGHRLLKAVYT